MKCGRIEIGAVGPDQSVNFWINPHPIKDRQVSQRSEQNSGKNGLKVDYLIGIVLKPNAQHIRTLDRECSDAVNRMRHCYSL